MASAFVKVGMEPLRLLPYGMPKPVASESSEMPVLDLSCKKSVSSSPSTTDSEGESATSPLRGSAFPDTKQETNNNNHITTTYKNNEHIQKGTEQPHQVPHHYQIPVDITTFPTSNHERKSPFENRAFIMTPPSESDSPKKLKYNQCYTHYPSLQEESPNTMPYTLPKFDSPVQLPITSTVLPPVLHQSPVIQSPPPQPIQVQNPPTSSTHESPQTTTPTSGCNSSEEAKKAPRPFKAYPKDPLSLTLGPDMIFDQDLKKAYTDFRSRMLDSVKKTNEGTNIKMRRTKSPLPTGIVDDKDAAYWERRRKNNEAAKRSRDARRAKEDEIAIRAAFLEQEYVRLKYENALLKEENSKMKCMIFSKF